MRQLLAKIPYGVLLPIAILLGLAPLHPEPHLVEKLRLLYNSQLTRPLDIFDLLLHAGPLLLLICKFSLTHQRSRAERKP